VAGNGIVTLEFVADTGRFVSGTQQVSQSSRAVEKDLEAATAATNKHNYQNMVAAHGVRELASASLMLSSQLPAQAQAMSLAAMSAGDLAGAYFRIKPAASSALAGIGALRAGLIGLAATAALVTVAATNNKTGWANLQQDGFKPAAAQLSILDGMVQKVPGHLGFLGSALDGVTDKLRTNAGWSHTAAAAQAELAAQAQRTAAILAAAHEASLFQAPDENPGGDATFTAADAAAISSQVYDQGTPGYMQRAMDESGLFKTKAGGGGGGAGAAIDKVAQALKDKLRSFQDIADKYSQVAKSIAESLGPKLQGGLDSSLMIYKGTTLVDNLKKQLQDTIHLKKDLAALSKAGLSDDLLTQLVNGGLGSLGTADELLAGGKKGIADVNALSAQIRKNANAVAGAETARQIKDQPRDVNVNVNVSGAQREFEVLLAKLFKTKGPKAFGLKAA